MLIICLVLLLPQSTAAATIQLTVLFILLCDLLLHSDRSLLLAELEKEEKEKDWYYAQLQNLTKRIDSLPLTENVRTLNETW